MSARMLGLEEGWIVRSNNLTLVGEENEIPFIRVWKPFRSKHVLKPWGKARKGKPKKNNIC